jgi:hypothetical protein
MHQALRLRSRNAIPPGLTLGEPASYVEIRATITPEHRKSLLDYVAADPSELRDLISVLEGIEERLVEIQGLAWTSDFGKE